MPVALITVLGTSLPNQDLIQTSIWIIDYDNTPESQGFIRTAKNSTFMDVYATGELAPIEPQLGESEAFGNVSESLAQKTLPTEYIDAYIIIPKGFSESLAANGTVEVDIYYDSIDFINRFVVEAFIMLAMTNSQLENLMFERDVIAFPETRPADFSDNINILEASAPIFVGLMLFFSMQLVTTQAIVGDVPLKRLLNTSLRRGEVVTGKIISYSVISVFQVILTMLLLQLFEVRFYCLWIDLFALLVLNSITGICMGVFISSISKTRLQGSQLFLMFFFVMFIAAEYIQNELFLNFIPLKQTQKAFSALAFRGLSIMEVIEPIFYIALTGLFYYILTLIVMKRKKEFI